MGAKRIDDFFSNPTHALQVVTKYVNPPTAGRIEVKPFRLPGACVFRNATLHFDKINVIPLFSYQIRNKLSPRWKINSWHLG